MSLNNFHTLWMGRKSISATLHLCWYWLNAVSLSGLRVTNKYTEHISCDCVHVIANLWQQHTVQYVWLNNPEAFLVNTLEWLQKLTPMSLTWGCCILSIIFNKATVSGVKIWTSLFGRDCQLAVFKVTINEHNKTTRRGWLTFGAGTRPFSQNWHKWFKDNRIFS